MKTKICLLALLLISTVLSFGQWTNINLSSPRGRMGAAVLDKKCYFAGGEANGQPVSTIEVYDFFLEDWDTSLNLTLSTPRMHPACVAAGTKVFFAGGAYMQTTSTFDMVDIWDTVARQWTYGALLQARVFLSAVSNGEKVLFAGGGNISGVSYDIVEIYDVSTGNWLPPESLSKPRSGIGSAVAGDMAFFAGGYTEEDASVTDVIDIYHFSTGTWTTDNLSVARGFLAGVAVGDKVIFAGGTTADNLPSSRVDIYDISDGTWTTAELSVPRALFPDPAAAVLCDQKAYFTSGGHFDLFQHGWISYFDVIDIFDAGLNLWTTENLPLPRLLHASAGAFNQFLVAGGITPPQSAYTNSIAIMTDLDCPMPGIESQPVDNLPFTCYPNPGNGRINLQIGNDNHKSIGVTIFNLQGQLLSDQRLNCNERTLNLNLPDGVYLLRVTTTDDSFSRLVTIHK